MSCEAHFVEEAFDSPMAPSIVQDGVGQGEAMGEARGEATSIKRISSLSLKIALENGQ